MLKLSMPIVYRPRVPYGRQNELFGFVTRVVDAEKGLADIVTFPAASETVHHNNIPQRSETIQVHCWEPAPDDPRIAALEERIAALEAQQPEGRKSRKPHADLLKADIDAA